MGSEESARIPEQEKGGRRCDSKLGNDFSSLKIIFRLVTINIVGVIYLSLCSRAAKFSGVQKIDFFL